MEFEECLLSLTVQFKITLSCLLNIKVTEDGQN